MFAVAMRLDRCQRRIAVDVTSARTVTQFALPVEHRRAAIDLHMRIGTESAGVACRAVGAVGRKRPNNFWGIGCVACKARNASSVCDESGAEVLVVRWNPAPLGVTIIAGLLCDEMVRRLAACHLVVVAAGAGTLGRVMVEPLRNPCPRDMTCAAVIVGPNVLRWLAAGDGVVVAAETAALGIRVIEGGRSPCRGHMTIAAGIGRRHVFRRLAARD